MLTKQILDMRAESLETCQLFLKNMESVAKIILVAAAESNEEEGMSDMTILALFAIQGFISVVGKTVN